MDKGRLHTTIALKTEQSVPSLSVSVEVVYRHRLTNRNRRTPSPRARTLDGHEMDKTRRNQRERSRRRHDRLGPTQCDTSSLIFHSTPNTPQSQQK